MKHYKKYIPGIIYAMMVMLVFKSMFNPIVTKVSTFGIFSLMLAIIASFAVDVVTTALVDKNHLNTFEEYVVEFVGIVASCVCIACMAALFHWNWFISLFQ